MIPLLNILPRTLSPIFVNWKESLNKIIAYANLEKREVTMELAETVLKDIISPNDKKIITPEYIINTVAEHYDITPEDIYWYKKKQ